MERTVELLKKRCAYWNVHCAPRDGLLNLIGVECVRRPFSQKCEGGVGEEGERREAFQTHSGKSQLCV